MQATVERLDKPSAYYLGRVRIWYIGTIDELLTCRDLQNKRRKLDRDRDRDRDDRDGSEKKVEDEEDPLKDATTLYVGNLYEQHRFGT